MYQKYRKTTQKWINICNAAIVKFWNFNGRFHFKLWDFGSSFEYFYFWHWIVFPRHYLKGKWCKGPEKPLTSFAWRFEIVNLRSSRPDVFCRKDVLKNFAKFTGKYLCQSLFFNKVAGLRPATLLKKRLWHRCFLVNFAKFLKTPFFYRIPLVAAPKSLYVESFFWSLPKSSQFSVV